MNSTNATPNEGQENKKINPKEVDAKDIKSMTEGSDDEVSFDSDYDKAQTGYDDVPNPQTGKDDKQVDLDRSGSAYQRAHSRNQAQAGGGTQNLKQQEQQQAGIPTVNPQGGDAVARRAGMNSGTQGIGTGSAKGYENNTDDTGLPPIEDDMNLASTDDEKDLSGAGGDDIDDVSDVSRIADQGMKQQDNPLRQ